VELKENLLSIIGNKLRDANSKYNDAVFGFINSVFNINPDEEIPPTIERSISHLDEPKDIPHELLELLSYKAILRDFNPNPEHMQIIIDEAKRRRIEPSLVLSIVAQESSFRYNAINRNRNGTNDYGYFQLNNRWHDQHRSNIEKHIETGLDHLKWCIDTENGNITRALIRYNTGNPNNSYGQRYASTILRIKRDIDSQFRTLIVRQRRAIRNLT